MRSIGVILLALTLFGGCTRPASTGWQGYLEGEFVYVGAPLAGRLEELAVEKGTRVTIGQRLFVLEQASERAAQREAVDRQRAAQARLADVKKGLRPSEIAAVEARLQQARATVDLSERELVRQRELFETRAIAASDFDRAQLRHERNTRTIDELTAQLATAQLGGRPDAIDAAEAEVAAAGAANERAEWSVAQKTQLAPAGALVYDTLFRVGEFVLAGVPVVALLPPASLKVRFFVPEPDLAGIQTGDRVRVPLPGRAAPLEPRVNFVSPRPEYTPPVLYNRDNRAKLVFMIEAALDAGAAVELHPGQPVAVAPSDRP